MANKNIIIANWKMNLDDKQSVSLIKKVLSLLKRSKKNKKLAKIDIVFCPSFTSLSQVNKVFKAKSNLFLGAQDCFWKNKGKYTGGISPFWLKNIGCSHVILGHSERRQYLSEDYIMINKKAKAALSAGLVPIICVGETYEERKKGLKDYVILSQVSDALNGIKLKPKQKLVLAYEPVWVIGLGRAVKSHEAEYMNKILLQRMIDLFPLATVKRNVRIIYGGSVNSSNIKELISEDNIDGALVGNASLDAKEFVKLCESIV